MNRAGMDKGWKHNVLEGRKTRAINRLAGYSRTSSRRRLLLVDALPPSPRLLKLLTPGLPVAPVPQLTVCPPDSSAGTWRPQRDGKPYNPDEPREMAGAFSRLIRCLIRFGSRWLEIFNEMCDWVFGNVTEERAKTLCDD